MSGDPQVLVTVFEPFVEILPATQMDVTNVPVGGFEQGVNTELVPPVLELPMMHTSDVKEVPCVGESQILEVRSAPIRLLAPRSQSETT